MLKYRLVPGLLPHYVKCVCGVFTAPRSYASVVLGRNSVRLSVRLSVCHTRAV